MGSARICVFLCSLRSDPSSPRTFGPTILVLDWGTAGAALRPFFQGACMQVNQVQGWTSSPVYILLEGAMIFIG